MRDPIIRQAFHSTILKSAHDDNETFVVDELGLKNGMIRADIAVLNGHLVGYEIKGEKDNLLRLPSQVLAYNEIFDKVYIIVSHNHLSKVIDLVPNWWGIYLIELDQNDICRFKSIRRSKLNKEQSSFSIAQLLWKNEALELANMLLSSELNPRTTRAKIYDIISRNCSTKQLSRFVIQYLKQRENWRSNLIQLS